MKDGPAATPVRKRPSVILASPAPACGSISDAGCAWALLTNRVHPTRHRDTGIDALRRRVGDLIVGCGILMGLPVEWLRCGYRAAAWRLNCKRRGLDR